MAAVELNKEAILSLDFLQSRCPVGGNAAKILWHSPSVVLHSLVSWLGGSVLEAAQVDRFVTLPSVPKYQLISESI